MGDFSGAIFAVPQLRDPAPIYIEADDGKMSCKIDRKRQADITKADDRDPDIVDTHHTHKASKIRKTSGRMSRSSTGVTP
ncbi:hypothetical protein [Pseudaminobacter sp. NGMCC 1.201702]|uniref:hypothetical protein n=1 Tax=Pseudaminobacter sp. NGMCC 1.201702 TaxID=3391825 RepID=UPI0039F0EC2F